MRYLFNKTIRDITSMWPQFFSVFMMAVLAITIYSGMEGVWYGLQTEVDKYYQEGHLADAWVTGKRLDQDMIEEIEGLTGVEKVSSSMDTVIPLKSDKDEKADIKLISLADTELFTPVVREGQDFNPDSPDGIWLDESMAKVRNIEVGDSLVLKGATGETSLQVKGLILHPEFIYYTGSVTETVPNHEIHGYGITGEGVAEMLHGQFLCNELRMEVKPSTDMERIQQETEDILGDNYYGFKDRDDMVSVSQITKEIQQMQNMANLFSALFILLVLLSMYTTMTRLINTQMMQVGTLKALGFTDGQIRFHYLLYGFFVSLVGGLLGTVFGRLLVSNAVMRIKKMTLVMPVWSSQLSWRTYLILVIIVSICILATLFAVRKGLKYLPAQVFHEDTGDRKGRLTEDKPSKVRDKIPFDWKWMFRDISDNKVRWVMGIIGVAGSMILMIAGLGFKDSIDFSNGYVYGHQFTYAYKGVLAPGYTEEDMLKIDSELGEEYETAYENNLDIYYPSGGGKEKRTISVYEGNKYVNLDDLSGKKYELEDDRGAISHSVAKKMGIQKGDVVKIRIEGERDYYDVEIGEVLLAPAPQGIFVSKKMWLDNFKKKYYPTTIFIGTETGYEKVKNIDGFKEITSIGQQTVNMDKMTKSVMSIIYLLIVASILLSVIILYNLGMLNFMERYREYATMKVIGFYQREIRSIILRDCFITTLIGWVIGVPLGYRFLELYIGIVQFKSFEWVPTLSTQNFILATIVVVSCSVIVNLWIAYKVTKIDMVEALKSVD